MAKLNSFQMCSLLYTMHLRVDQAVHSTSLGGGPAAQAKVDVAVQSQQFALLLFSPHQ